MTLREAVAYGLIAILAGSLAFWIYRDRKRKRALFRKRFGPREE